MLAVIKRHEEALCKSAHATFTCCLMLSVHHRWRVVACMLKCVCACVKLCINRCNPVDTCCGVLCSCKQDHAFLVSNGHKVSHPSLHVVRSAVHAAPFGGALPRAVPTQIRL